MQTSVQKGIKEIGRALTKNSPAILTGLAVAGLVSTTILAVKATPKAIAILEDANRQKYFTRDQWSKQDIIRLTWKCYIPTGLMAGVTIGCIIGANSIHLRRNAALATLYSFSETALKEYQAKVVEVVGAKQAQVVKDEIAKDRINQNPVVGQEVILTTYGETLCYDSLSGRYFRSDIEKIRQAQNEANSKIVSGMDDYISLNELYYELGLPSIKIGEEIGWSFNTTGMIDINFSSQLATNGVPCLVMDYVTAPKYEYDC